MSERENVVTIVRKATRIQQQAIEETKKEISYSQLVRVGKLIAEASCVDFYVYDMNVYLAEYGRSLIFSWRKSGQCTFCDEYSGSSGIYACEWTYCNFDQSYGGK